MCTVIPKESLVTKVIYELIDRCQPENSGAEPSSGDMSSSESSLAACQCIMPVSDRDMVKPEA